MNKITRKELKERNNHYEGTINTLLCFISLTTWGGGQRNENTFYSFGRRMTTSGSNPVSPNQEITPDAVIQVLDDQGFVVEAKITLPMDETYWEKILEQLRKYDDDLVGWWTENSHINRRNAILLIHMARGADFNRFMASQIEKGLYPSNNNVVGIEFVLSRELKEYILFRTRWGIDKIYDQILADKLLRGVPVPLEEVKVSYANIKFYDCRPEPEYLLSTIWQDILTHLAREVDFNKRLNCYPINISIQSLTRELQKSFGSKALQQSCNLRENDEREVEYPELSWVREALELLIKLELASRLSENEYTVYFRHLKLRQERDLIDYFSRYRTKKELISEEGQQPLPFADT